MEEENKKRQVNALFWKNKCGHDLNMRVDEWSEWLEWMIVNEMEEKEAHLEQTSNRNREDGISWENKGGVVWYGCYPDSLGNLQVKCVAPFGFVSSLPVQ